MKIENLRPTKLMDIFNSGFEGDLGLGLKWFNYKVDVRKDNFIVLKSSLKSNGGGSIVWNNLCSMHFKYNNIGVVVYINFNSGGRLFNGLKAIQEVSRLGIKIKGFEGGSNGGL